MSRFFRRGGDDSSSDSSSDEEELYSGEEDQDLKQDDSDKDSDDLDSPSEDDSEDTGEKGTAEPQAGGASRFLRDIESDSEGSETEVRAKVKSAKLKRMDELDASIKLIENGQKNGDWTLIAAGTTCIHIVYFELGRNNLC